jgi:CubicO group peptidase (beta-lactamase class C family)
VRRLGLPRRPSPDVATHALSPATGFYASAEDLCRYAAAHFRGDVRLLSDAAKREMQQPYWTVEQADEHYGLGFSVVTIGERRMVGHGGGCCGRYSATLRLWIKGTEKICARCSALHHLSRSKR